MKYPTVLSFEAAAPDLSAYGRIEIDLPPSAHVDFGNRPVLLRLVLPSREKHEMWAGLRRSDDRLQLFVLRTPELKRVLAYLDSTSAHARKAREQGQGLESAPPDVQIMEEVAQEENRMPLRRRLQRMGYEEKVNLALSGDREARLALAQDGNRAIHPFLLRNAKLSIDEVLFMARLPSLNPDVLDKIAENPKYVQNVAIAKALVFNPRTPLKTSLRLLDRLPRSDLSVLARRTSMQRRLVIAAKNKLSRGSG